jgi:hypothetical protein
MLIALYSLVRPDELRTEIAFAQAFVSSRGELPKAALS